MKLQNSASKRLLASVLAVLAGWLATAVHGADTFTPTGSLATGRQYPTATLLTNGTVLVAGGAVGVTPQSIAELYNPATGSWTNAGNLPGSRWFHTATLLANGKVLIAGGYTGAIALPSTALFDPVANTWTVSGNLVTARYSPTATLLTNGMVLVVGGNNGSNLLSAELYNPANSTWTTTGNLSIPRNNHTATLLGNGKVLVAGGSSVSGVTNSAELYDPATGTWSATGAMAAGRQLQSAVLLPNGKVLVAAGYNGSSTLASVEVYSPGTGTWTNSGSLATSRYWQNAALLPNGKVLVAGGFQIGTGLLASAEVWDPATGSWAATGRLGTAREYFAATLLVNGKALVVGGLNGTALASAELYDPLLAIWNNTGSLGTPRQLHTATLLTNGTVLVTAGSQGIPRLATAERYDPATSRWTPTGSLTTPRDTHTATLLPNGKVLVAGGFNGFSNLLSAELYDPTTNGWNVTANLSTARASHVAVLLPNGKVLVAGGNSGSSPLASAELYNPTNGTWAPTGNLGTPRWNPTATLLANGKVLIAGGYSGSGVTATAELYDPTAGTWSPTGPLATARQLHSAALLLNGKVLIAAGYTGSGWLASAELYDPTSGSWTNTGSLANARYWQTTTLLPSGKVLITGGFNSGSSLLDSAELFDPAGNGGLSSWFAAPNLRAPRQYHTATLLPSGQVLLAGGNSSGGLVGSAEVSDASLNFSGVVTVNGDASSGLANGLFTLREAIALSASNSTITFTSTLSGATITLTNGELPLNKSVTIDARSLPAGMTINGSNTTRLFDQATNTTCTILGLTLTGGFSTNGGAIYNSGGTLNLTNCVLSANKTPQTNAVNSGGGIYNNGGALTLNTCTLSANQSVNGGAIDSLGGSLVMTNCTLSGNIGQFSGQATGVGAIRNSGQMTLTDCVLSSNPSGGTPISSASISTLTRCNVSSNSCWAIGAANNSGTMSLTNCTLQGNSAFIGGGVGAINNSGTLTIDGSIISGNSGSGAYGAIGNGGTLTINRSTLSGNSGGSGIIANSSLLTINNSTIGNNFGVGIRFWGGTLTLNNSTISGNTETNSPFVGGIHYDTNNSSGPGTILLTNTILSGNNSPTNIFGPFSGANNLTDGDPLLAPLGNYGGPTLTMPPLPGSPAIDAGLDSVTSFLPTDQRGYPRLVAAHVDLGAVEAYSQALVSAVGDSGPGSLRDAAANVDAGAKITFAPGLSGQTITLTGGQLTLAKNVTIDASALLSGLSLSGNNSSRVFEVAAGAVVNLSALNIQNGYAPNGNNPTNYGGGILNRGTLALTNCTLTANQAQQGSKPVGGGIANYSVAATLILQNCLVSSNHSDAYGGGGIDVNNGVVSINQCTFTANSSTNGHGGGINVEAGSVTINQCTVSSNSASTGGGVAKNGTLTISNSIVAGNVATIGPNISGSFAGAHNLTSGNPLLAPLGNYGGATLTMPPLPGSPAIDGCTGGTSFTTDQRGYPRIVGTYADIGAVEDAPPTATNLSAGETYIEDTPLNLIDIVVSDVDSATVTVTLTLSNPGAGSLSMGTSGAVTSTYNAGTGVWAASGAIADVNTLLAGVTFTPAISFNSNFTIATSVSDGIAPPVTGVKTMSTLLVVTIPGPPTNPTYTANPHPSFIFSTSGGVAPFATQCRVDTDAWIPGTSPFTTPTLDDGPHTFYVQATDTASHVASNGFTFTVDTTPPAVIILTGPNPRSNNRTPSFTFSVSDASPTSIYCRIDTNAFAPCLSPFTTAPLNEGFHTFEVYATDAAGNVGTSSSYTFFVDLTGPTVAIPVPPNLTNTTDNTPAFIFTSEPGAVFFCGIDGGAFVSGSSPFTIVNPLADGPHTFAVYAIDSVGNSGPTNSFAFTVDTAPPTPPTLTNAASINGAFRFTVQGVTGTNYVVEATTNFSQWTSLVTNAGPAFDFTNPPPSLPWRFFRARLSP